MSVTVRPATSDDLQHIAEFYRTGLATEIQGTPEMEKNFIRMPSGQSWIAEWNGQPAGFVTIQGEDLRYIYIHPDFHGRGIGKQLMTVAMEHISGTPRLLVYTHNTKARKLYESFGFKPVPDAEANSLMVYKKTGSGS